MLILSAFFINSGSFLWHPDIFTFPLTTPIYPKKCFSLLTLRDVEQMNVSVFCDITPRLVATAVEYETCKSVMRKIRASCILSKTNVLGKVGSIQTFTTQVWRMKTVSGLRKSITKFLCKAVFIISDIVCNSQKNAGYFDIIGLLKFLRWNKH